MQIVLIKEVPNLGKIGEVIPVKPGFARNFLLPNDLAALVGSAKALAVLESQKEKKEEKMRQAEIKKEKRIKQEEKRQAMVETKAKLLQKKTKKVV